MSQNAVVIPPEQLHNLRVFIAVADSTSIARAGDALHKAASAISRSIIELEKSIGVSLFERKPRGMLVNSFGRAVLERARRIQDELQAIADGYSRAGGKSAPSSASVIAAYLFNGRRLELIVQLAASRNISIAAKHVGITPAGASMALGRIEAVLGQPVFERQLHGLVATEKGDALVTSAKRVFAELRHMSSEIASLSGTVSGHVVMGALPLGRTYFIPRAVAATIARHPELQVVMLDSPYVELMRDLRSGDVDVVIGTLRPGAFNQGVTTERLFEENFIIVARAGHPLAARPQMAAADLVGQKWVLPRSISISRTGIDASFRKLGLEPPVASVETQDLGVVRELVLDSDMLAVTSPHQLMFELQSGAAVQLPVVLDEAKREVGLILREGAKLSPASNAVLDEIRREVDKLLA